MTPTTCPNSTDLHIDGDRLWADLMDLAAIGAYDDEATGLVGVNRQSLTDEDRAGRELLISWMEELGLEVEIDEMGTIFGRREGLDPELAPVLIGSHIDTVATAGAFDGCLGVLGGLAVIRAFAEAGLQPRRPIVVAAWTEEEGVRFGTDMLGSAVAAGRLSLDCAYGLTDATGARFGDELRRIGFRGERPVRLDPPHAYLECHIEQGPVLAQEDRQIGIVTGVQSISWQRVTFHGRAAHAGTTPTELRIDAGLAAAQIIVEVRRMVDSGAYGRLRATVGRAEADLAVFLDRLPDSQPGLRVETAQMARTKAVPFSEAVQDTLETAAKERGYDSMRLMSGAGHDAQEMAAIAPAAMVFVRGQHHGISHNPREYSTPEDCLAGVEVLASAVKELSA